MISGGNDVEDSQECGFVNRTLAAVEARDLLTAIMDVDRGKICPVSTSSKRQADAPEAQCNS